jgi:hypothetical protein
MPLAVLLDRADARLAEQPTEFVSIVAVKLLRLSRSRLTDTSSASYHSVMGLGLPFLKDIIALKRVGLLEGYRHIVEIGAQQISDRLIASPELDEVVALFGGTKPALTPVGAPRIRPNSPPGRATLLPRSTIWFASAA